MTCCLVLQRLRRCVVLRWFVARIKLVQLLRLQAPRMCSRSAMPAAVMLLCLDTVRFKGQCVVLDWQSQVRSCGNSICCFACLEQSTLHVVLHRWTLSEKESKAAVAGCGQKPHASCACGTAAKCKSACQDTESLPLV